MASMRFKLNSGGMKSLLNSGGVRAHLTSLMGGAESAAKGSAPVASGEYRDSIHIVQDTTDRVAVRLVASAPHAMVVESKTGNLARALDAAGG